MGGRLAFYTAADTVEAFIKQGSEAPPGAIAGQAIQVVDMDISITMGVALFF
jgi:hypothetical protein